MHEAPAAGLCTNMQNLAVELAAAGEVLCGPLVPSMLCRSEDQLAFPTGALLASGASSEVLGLSIDSRKVHAAFLGRNKTACTLRLQGRGAAAMLSTWKSALHCLGWVKRILLVLKIKENE